MMGVRAICRRQLGILSRSNSKRGLLKKIKSWRQRSACGNDINLDDSISTVNSGEITRPVTAWDEFENHIRQVNDNSGPMEFDEKTLDFKCSDTFKRIMNELSPRKVKKIEKKLSTSSLLSKRETLIGEGGENGDIKEEEEVEGDIDDDDDDNDAFVVGETDHDPRRRKRALRAWGSHPAPHPGDPGGATHGQRLNQLGLPAPNRLRSQ